MRNDEGDITMETEDLKKSIETTQHYEYKFVNNR